MKIVKKIFLACCISLMTVLCVVFSFAPAFADMKKVEDAELARMNASVTGASVKDRTNCVEKDGICSEAKQDRLTVDKGAAISTLDVTNNAADFIDVSLRMDGKEAFQFGMSGFYSNRVGGTITSVQSR